MIKKLYILLIGDYSIVSKTDKLSKENYKLIRILYTELLKVKLSLILIDRISIDLFQKVKDIITIVKGNLTITVAVIQDRDNLIVSYTSQPTSYIDLTEFRD